MVGSTKPVFTFYFGGISILKSCLLVIIFVVFAVTGSFVCAQKNTVTQINFKDLDGNIYGRDGLMRQFLRVAFPAYTLFDDPSSNNLYLPSEDRQKTLAGWEKRMPPWILEFALRKRGTPKFDAISRWPRDITVGVGFPPPNRVTDEERRLLEKIKPVFSAMHQNVEAATGRSFQLLSPSEETASVYAKIRIVPLAAGYFSSSNRFKAFRRAGVGFIPAVIDSGEESTPEYKDQMPMIEGHMWDAVRFTPRARAQVDGYFVTDKDNNIEFAVCYLWPQHKDGLLQTLIAECMLRAMGLPEMAAMSKRSLLGRWNAAHDAHSKLPILDGWKDIKSDAALYDDAFVAEAEGRIGEAIKIKNVIEGFPYDAVADEELPSISMTDLDKAMLRILYCPYLKSGLGRYEVAREIAQHSGECGP